MRSLDFHLVVTWFLSLLLISYVGGLVKSFATDYFGPKSLHRVWITTAAIEGLLWMIPFYYVIYVLNIRLCQYAP